MGCDVSLGQVTHVPMDEQRQGPRPISYPARIAPLALPAPADATWLYKTSSSWIHESMRFCLAHQRGVRVLDVTYASPRGPNMPHPVDLPLVAPREGYIRRTVADTLSTHYESPRTSIPAELPPGMFSFRTLS